MRILEIRPIHGPNIFHYKPVLVMTIDLEDQAQRHSADIEGFTDRLVALLPGLQEHRCSKGYPGGFIERLRTGTYFAHIIEHIALELSEAAGIPVYYGKSIYGGSEGVYKVIVRFKAQAGMEFLLRAAVDIASAVAAGQPYDLQATLKSARRVVSRNDLGPSTRAIVEAAQSRGIPWMRIGDDSLVQLGYGKSRRLIQAAVSDRTGMIAGDIAQDKELTKKLLKQAFIPVPGGRVVRSEEEAIETFLELRVPIVVKPLDGHHGEGVSLGLRTTEEVSRAYHIASEYGDDVLIEELFQGRDHRILVVGYQVVAASERVPAHVRGDGKHSVRELVEIENRNPLRGEGHGFPLTLIETDDPLVHSCLARQGQSLDSIPKDGQNVFLRETANLSTGGTAIDVTDELHPEIRSMCERAARIVGLDICGVDLIANDISRPIGPNEACGIIEVNAGPGIRMHHFPAQGKPRDVGGAIVQMLFPEPSASRIPIISITGTNGKTTVTRLIAHLISGSGKIVGLTTTDGISIGGKSVTRGDTTGPVSARALLIDPTVEVAVLETARGGLARAGLAYDWSDIAVMTNIHPDHIGQDGIESVEDILHIKSLVAERVRAGGTLVLNADDPLLARLSENPRIAQPARDIVYFSTEPDHLLIRKQIAEGRKAYFLRDGWVVEAIDGKETPFIAVSDIPITLGGAAKYQISNALAALAAARALPITVETATVGLKTFRNELHNEGRANLYRIGKGFLLMDYGHNLEAFRAIGEMAAHWNGRRVTCIVGVPGDRSDWLLSDAARVVAKHFERIIVREDYHLRGRKPGEIAELLRSAIVSENPQVYLRVIPDEKEAVRTAVSEMQEGEVIVLFYDELDYAREVIMELGAAPITGLPDGGRETTWQDRTQAG